MIRLKIRGEYGPPEGFLDFNSARCVGSVYFQIRGIGDAWIIEDVKTGRTHDPFFFYTRAHQQIRRSWK